MQTRRHTRTTRKQLPIYTITHSRPSTATSVTKKTEIHHYTQLDQNSVLKMPQRRKLEMLQRVIKVLETFQSLRWQLDVWIRLIWWNWIWKADFHFQWKSFICTGCERGSNHLGRGLVSSRAIDEACHRLTANTLEVNMTTLGFLLLPGHVYKRPLSIVVDHCKHQEYTKLVWNR